MEENPEESGESKWHCVWIVLLILALLAVARLAIGGIR